MSYSPQYIAESFVKQYYEILSSAPADLHKFYMTNANFSFNESSQDSDYNVGMESIRHRVQNLNLYGSIVDWTSGNVQAQTIDNSRLLVMVNGTYTHLGQHPKPFVNSFVLVGVNHAYFVSNSIFRSLPSSLSSLSVPPLFPQPIANTSVQPSSSPAIVKLEPSSSFQSQRNATEILKSVIDVSNSSFVDSHQGSSSSLVLQDQSQPVHNTESQYQESAVETATSADEEPIVTEEESVPEEEPVPSYEEVTQTENHAGKEDAKTLPEMDGESSTTGKSYLDIVKRLASQGISSQEKQNTSQNPRVVRPRAAPPSSSTASAHDNNSVSKSGEVAARVKEGIPLYAVYVTSLPENVNELDLAKVFSIFGKVMQVDLARGRKYGFIKFDSPTAMQAALDHQLPLELNGHSLQVEVKTSPKIKTIDGKKERRERDREGKVEKTDRIEKSPRSRNGDFKPKVRKDGEKDRKQLPLSQQPSQNKSDGNLNSANINQTKLNKK